ncbi:MAG: hypothetical protein ACPGU5_06385 [Lishizhenia sp.]
MEILITFFVGFLPATAICVVVYLFLKKQNDTQVQHIAMELKKERQQHLLPSRVEAYQRAVLFMERISPGNLVMRLHTPGKPAKAMQADLLKSIREEYDHNVAQQIFISTQAWEMVKEAKEETIKIINIAAKSMDESATGTELSSKIFEIVAEVGDLPTEITIKFLKEELQRLF